MYAQRITQKKFAWGSKVLITPFPAGGSVSLVGSFLGGSRFADSREVAEVYADMLLEGTRLHSKKEIQVLLDEIGATLAFFVTDERIGFSGRVRSVHIEKLLALVSELLRESTFPEQELRVFKKREESSLLQELQDTNHQAAIALSRTLFPKTHPNYAESTREAQEELRTITSQKLRKLHGRMLSRNTLILSLAGDISTTKVQSLVEKHFKHLPDRRVALPRFAKAKALGVKKVVVPIKNKASIDYMAGLITAMTNNNKDFPALVLGMQILGSPSGFSGRLMKTVREEEGLTYGVYAYTQGFTSTTDGYLSVWGTFAPQLFTQGRRAIQRELRTIVEKGVTQEEVLRHREMYFSRSRVRLSTSSAFARAAHDVVAQNKSLSYLDTFPTSVRKLNLKEVNRVLKKYLKPSFMSEVAVGPVEKNVLSK